MKYQTILAITLSAISINIDAASNWSYTNKSTNPTTWANQFHTCGGHYQSPIDLPNNGLVYLANLGKIKMFTSKKNSSAKYTVSNNGHSLMINFPPDVYTVALNEDTDETYDVLQMHFHWGSTNQVGSEHTVDGRTYALEGHLVCYNNKLYKSFSEAAGSPSGLAVLAFLSKVEEDAKTDKTQIGILTGLEESIPKVGNPNQNTMIDPFDLSKIFSQVQADEYYRYYGSLTTPPCTENVVWTVFRKPIPITSHQLNLFRGLKFPVSESQANMMDNYRPVQPLNTKSSPFPRTVFKSWNAANRIEKTTWMLTLTIVLKDQLFSQNV
ncbi:Carbonic anhydrase [Paragonimus heterotremus]|uniref:Carbonic anhydrase n=1 Tax=Paragonimus heterotremus TaxID=100268 RepID=A0A8J4TMX6_9TREM|nr:Carbonic anhydrase [Paragonimus heterotremus]